MKRQLVYLLGAFLLAACSTTQNTAQTAIAMTISAEGTANIFSQQQTLMAVAQMQLSQSAVSLAQQQTQAALGQTQAALAVQMASTPTQNGTSQPVADGTQAATSIPGINPISSMGVDFNGARVYSQGSYNTKSHGYMISVQLAESVKEIQGKFFLEVAAKKFTCSLNKLYSNRLYCIGLWPRGGYHAVRLYEDLPNAAGLVFVADIIVPDWTPTNVVRPSKTPD